MAEVLDREDLCPAAEKPRWAVPNARTHRTFALQGYKGRV